MINRILVRVFSILRALSSYQWARTTIYGKTRIASTAARPNGSVWTSCYIATPFISLPINFTCHPPAPHRWLDAPFQLPRGLVYFSAGVRRLPPPRPPSPSPLLQCVRSDSPFTLLERNERGYESTCGFVCEDGELPANFARREHENIGSVVKIYRSRKWMGKYAA